MTRNTTPLNNNHIDNVIGDEIMWDDLHDLDKDAREVVYALTLWVKPHFIEQILSEYNCEVSLQPTFAGELQEEIDITEGTIWVSLRDTLNRASSFEDYTAYLDKVSAVSALIGMAVHNCSLAEQGLNPHSGRYNWTAEGIAPSPDLMELESREMSWAGSIGHRCLKNQDNGYSAGLAYKMAIEEVEHDADYQEFKLDMFGRAVGGAVENAQEWAAQQWQQAIDNGEVTEVESIDSKSYEETRAFLVSKLGEAAVANFERHAATREIDPGPGNMTFREFEELGVALSAQPEREINEWTVGE